jgi:ABC-type Na+ transport system ATPase subunit NatA
MKPSKKPYFFLQTLPAVADVITKVRLMHTLTVEEELVYLMQVKNMSKEEAEKIIENRSNIPKIT